MSRHRTRSSATAQHNTTVVRLSGPQGLALAVPQYLGFHPERSLVLLCLTAPRGRVGPVARIDLFDPAEADPSAQLVACAVRYADAVAVLCYHDGPRPQCLDVLLAGLAGAGVSVTDVLSVADGRIRRADTQRRQLDDPGVPLPDRNDAQAQRLAAASALAGRQPLPSRESLARSIAGPTGQDARTARDAIAAARKARRLADPDESPAATQRAIAAALVEEAMDQHASRGHVDSSTAADLIAFCDTVTGRDLLIAAAIAPENPDVVAMLVSVAGRTPDAEAPGICSVLAVAAYRFGDGALAHCAIDRVLAREPGHRLAHLMAAAISGGLPPHELASMAGIGVDEGDGAGWDGDGDWENCDWDADDWFGDDEDYDDEDHDDGTNVRPAV